jgi:hypothetical protein
LPLIALIYADQESFISSISVDQRDQRLKYLLASFLRHQGKEKEFFAVQFKAWGVTRVTGC